jgi:hypothetical protein
MIQTDAAKAIKFITYFKSSDWQEKYKVEKDEAPKDDQENDAKHRQQTSYQEVLDTLMEKLKEDHDTKIDIEK